MKKQTNHTFSMSEIFTENQIETVMGIHRHNNTLYGLIKSLKRYFHSRTVIKRLTLKKIDPDYMAYVVADLLVNKA